MISRALNEVGSDGCGNCVAIVQDQLAQPLPPVRPRVSGQEHVGARLRMLAFKHGRQGGVGLHGKVHSVSSKDGGRAGAQARRLILIKSRTGSGELTVPDAPDDVNMCSWRKYTVINNRGNFRWLQEKSWSRRAADQQQ
jgi:hypothetical protein